MAITASLVKELRERTGAGMMECKKALSAAEGDIEKAIEEMRKSGQAKAAKKAGRVAAEGVVIIKTSDDRKQAVMLEINTETDFVARDETFSQFADAVAQAALSTQANDIAALSGAEFSAGKTVETAREEIVAKIGENIQLRRLNFLQTEGVIGAYTHGVRIGVLLDMQGGNAEVAKDVAMHIAAMRPEAVSPDQVPQAVIDKEKEIFSAQAAESGKPAEIIEKMIGGRMKKFLAEVSLTGQAFVRDPNQTIGDLLKANNAEVKSFVRFEVGEGIEKEETDFAAEVKAAAEGK
ncbi:MAG: elongation factor Ts [Legionellaceae bacterium]|nr:elongation factor Ts [Legionellaceae bacterium]|tara:strand:- start:1337 stop:2215 length:879 start_codon:yes stop_codon:yes gene_type:complete